MSYTSLLDGDILGYELGQDCIAGNYILWKEARYNCDKKVQHIIDQAGCCSAEVYLTDSQSNFRIALATIKPYKGNRDEHNKPPYWDKIRHHLLGQHGAEVCYGYEADDAMAMGQSDDTVICSRDKDPDQVPGWHYSWECGKQKERKLYQVSEVEGLRTFYTQLIMGDTGDNIPGLFRVGRVTADKQLAQCICELEMYKVVQKMYEDRFGSYWELFLVENAKLLYLLRNKEDVWKIPG
jgi:hypothetical protein